MNEQMKPLRWEEVAATSDPRELPFLKYFSGSQTTPAAEGPGESRQSCLVPDDPPA